MGEFEEIVRFDGEDNLTPKLDEIASGFKRVTDAVDYLAELASADAEALDKLSSSLGAVGETAVPALTNLHNTFLMLGMDIGQVDAQTNALIAKNGELASSYTDLVASEKEQQIAMLTGLETQTLLQQQMGAALPVLEQTSQLYQEMEAQSAAYMRSLGQLADVSTLSADATRTLSDGTVVARESLLTAGGAALLAASQTRVYDESLRGVDITLQQTAVEQQQSAAALAKFQAELAQGSTSLSTMTVQEQDAAEAAYLLAEKLGLAADGSTQVNTALRFSLVELDSLTKAFSSSAVSVLDFVAAGYNIKDVNAGLDVLVETGDAAAAAMRVLTSEFGKFSSVAVPALTDLHNTFNILGQDVTQLDEKTNELIAKNIELADSYKGLSASEREQQAAMLTGLQTQNEAKAGVVEIGDALQMTKAEQLAFSETTLQSLTAMYAQGLAAGEDAGKLAALRAQIVETAASMDTLAASEASTAAKTGEMNAGFGMSQFLLFTIGMMAFSAGQQFFTMGLTSGDAIARIQERLGETDAQTQEWVNTVTDLGSHWGFTLAQTLPAFDAITRAQFQAADATHVLDEAMQLARVTGNQVTDTTDLLVTSLKAYGAGADQATAFTDILRTTLDNSRFSIQELTSLMGNSLPIAASLGISFADLSSTVAAFSQSTASGVIATRDFQAMLSGLQNFAALSADQLAKLAGAFDLTKFAAMDFTAKLTDLAKASNGNEQAFTSLIGGANNAKIAMDNLDISDKQLAANAAALGVTFNRTTFDSLDAAGKLLYLSTIVDFSGPKFAKLTDGTKGTNEALAKLGPSLDAAGQKAFDMSSKFDMAKFKSDDLAQKLHDLSDFLGGPYSSAFIKAIGGPQNLTLALQKMNSEADKNTVVKVDAKQATDAKKHVDAMTLAHQHLKDALEKKIALGPISTKPYDDTRAAAEKLAKDNKAALDKVSSDWSTLGNDFNTKISPLIIKGIQGIETEFKGLNKGPNSIPGDFADLIKQTAQFGTDMGNALNNGPGKAFKDWQNATDKQLTKFFTQDIPNAIKGGKGAETDAIKANDNALSHQQDIDLTALGKIISTFFTTTLPNIIEKGASPAETSSGDITRKVNDKFKTGGDDWGTTIKGALDKIESIFNLFRIAVVGASIIPEMVDAITREFTTGGTDWLTPITTFITNAENAFNTALAVIPAIATSIGAGVNSAFVTAGATWNATVGAAMSTVVATVQSWVGAAMSAGAAVGNAIGDGLQSAVGWVSQAASNLAGAIASVLPHSPAESGPLMHLDTFMPGMIDTLVSTMNANAYKLKVPSLQLASTISMPVQGLSTTVPASFTAQGGATTDMTPVVQVLVQIYQVLRSQQAQGTSTGGMQGWVRNTPTQQEIVRAIYNALNVYGGKTYESGGRGAFAGLGV